MVPQGSFARARRFSAPHEPAPPINVDRSAVRRTGSAGRRSTTTHHREHHHAGDQRRRSERDATISRLEDHLLRDREVVRDTDDRVDHHGGGEHDPDLATLDRRPEDQELGPEPTGGRHARQRDHEDRHADGEQGRAPRQPGEVGDQQTWGPPAHGGDHRERPEVHHAIDQDVGDRRRERQPVRRDVPRHQRERQQDVPGLCDPRIRQQSHDLRLLQRHEVPDRHRRERQEREHRHPELVLAHERDEHQLQQAREARGLGGDGEERRDRHRRTLVGVRRPELERERRHLEREADDHEQDRADASVACAASMLESRRDVAQPGGTPVIP